MGLTIEKIMDASFGETNSEIRATYKKTVNVRQYETEVIELETTLKLDKELTGGERMLVSALLQAQLEYTAYCQLAFKGLVTPDQLTLRKNTLEEGINAIKAKVEGVLGKSLDDLLEHKKLTE